MTTGNWWLAFVIFSLIAYFAVAVLVAVGGVKDLRDLLKHLSQEKNELK